MTKLISVFILSVLFCVQAYSMDCRDEINKELAARNMGTFDRPEKATKATGKDGAIVFVSGSTTVEVYPDKIVIHEHYAGLVPIPAKRTITMDQQCHVESVDLKMGVDVHVTIDKCKEGQERIRHRIGTPIGDDDLLLLECDKDFPGWKTDVHASSHQIIQAPAQPAVH